LVPQCIQNLEFGCSLVPQFIQHQSAFIISPHSGQNFEPEGIFKLHFPQIMVGKFGAGIFPCGSLFCGG